MKRNKSIHWGQGPINGYPPLEFHLTSMPQDAVFEISVGWTGGMGEAVLEPCFTSIRHFNGYPIFFDITRIDHVLAGNLPSSWSGELRVRVSANITLTLKEARNYSIPGAPRETFYEAELNRLHDIYILLEVGEISPILDLKDLRASLTRMSALIDAGFGLEEIDHMVRLVREMHGPHQRVCDYPIIIDRKNATLSVRLAMDHRKTRSMRFFITAQFHEKLDQEMHGQFE